MSSALTGHFTFGRCHCLFAGSDSWISFSGSRGDAAAISLQLLKQLLL